MTENMPETNPAVLAAEARPMPGSMDLPYDVSNPTFIDFTSFNVTTFPGHPGKMFVTVRSGGCTLQGTMTPEMMEQTAGMLAQAARQGRSGLIVPNGTIL